MGNIVLDAGTSQSSVHLYAHCPRDGSGGVALLALDLPARATSLNLDGGRGTSYALTAKTLESSTVSLNGKPLAMTADGKLPELAGKPLPRGPVSLAPKSIEFIRVPAARGRRSESYQSTAINASVQIVKAV